ncbi:MAG: hypothetical protein H5U40_07285 [Polyangiaceae bacterium]|nr:hypothetical protein [Polyangiaceae bacterium]
MTALRIVRPAQEWDRELLEEQRRIARAERAFALLSRRIQRFSVRTDRTEEEVNR